MNWSVIRYWGLGTLALIIASGCTTTDQPSNRLTVDTKRPVLIIKPVEHKKSNKVIYGKASFYANMFQGHKTANGQIFDQGKLTAAHRTLAFGTKVKVTNVSNNKSVIVTVNDRGPFVRGRMIDLSSSAFRAIGNTRSGVLNVKMEILK
ncbi:septal ring lytic transglycosylase RlpA family protein [Photobacterium kishitanii]|uniref:septal ring lytic transglycosylase RlpA family protein n=1 Tax=Photobacterium kishitanii TaxID=318456 RepID=UPI000D171DB3|nr:septal ring lytic transglycosylase RlpA family protein [Photobacterium kishitanii]PSV15561.1 septal ring lytic transglycosylase RlpA family lipoprotein [Photobacterium kishitanii]